MSRLMIVVTTAVLFASAAHSANFEPETMTVSASSILEPGLLVGEHYTIAGSVTVDGYMNHYSVDSEFGPFSVAGDWALKKLLHEIDAIAELRRMTSLSTGADAVVGTVADTGKSLANLAIHPVESSKGMSAGVSRFFKRTTRTATDLGGEVTETVSESINVDEQVGEEQNGEGENDADNDNKEGDDPGLGMQLTSSFMGIGKAHRELARELEVDPYSDNAILQTEMSRVANISGSVGKITSILIPIPSAVGIAADIGDMVWSLSPMDLLIQNEESLKALGYTDELIQTFFSNTVFSPTKQTAIVAALASLDKVKGRKILLNIANSAETRIQGQFIAQSILFVQLYHETVKPITELVSTPNGLLPVVLTASGDGLLFLPLDHLLWTEEVAKALEKLAKLIDDHGATNGHLMWVKGRVSDLALAQLSTAGWTRSTEHFDKLESVRE